MKVLIIPKKPIPGILPKNKWIDTKMVLDLNKNEILHCMQFGTVYDESGNMIDSIRVKNIPTSIHKEIIQKPITKPVIVEETVSTSITVSEGEPMVIEAKSNPIEEPVIIMSPITVEPIVEEVIEEPVKVEEVNIVEDIKEDEPTYFSYSREDDYIIVKAISGYDCNIEGNLYGLFTITSGPRPSSIEYLNGDTWVKFSNKFANFDVVKPLDLFIFRFIPKNENEFSFKISIKEANQVLLQLEDKVNPSEI